MNNYNDVNDEVFSDGSRSVLSAVVGHSIVSAEKTDTSENDDSSYILRLDNGTTVRITSFGECCAYAMIDKIFINNDNQIVSNIITNVERKIDESSSHSSERWFFLTDATDINSSHVSTKNSAMIIDVSADFGTGYYSYGFSVDVIREN